MRAVHSDYLIDISCISMICMDLSGWFERTGQSCLEFIIEHMRVADGVTENLKVAGQMARVGAMNSIRNLAEKIVKSELIYN